MFFATVLQNVWSMLDLNCINYFMNIFPWMSSFQNFLNLPGSYLTYVIQATFLAWLFLPGDAACYSTKSRLSASYFLRTLTIFSRIFYLFSPLGQEISQRLLEPIPLSPFFQDLDNIPNNVCSWTDANKFLASSPLYFWMSWSLFSTWWQWWGLF